MADKPFRVLLDLTDLHIESFKYVWISVSPREVKTIADFKESLLQKINLGSEDIRLFVRDGLLLEEETIIVLREEDTVKVQYGSQFNSFQEHIPCSMKKQKKSSAKRNFSECNSDPSSDPRKKQIDNCAVSNQDEMHEEEIGSKKRKKQKLNNLPFCDGKINYSTVQVDGQSSVAVRSKKKKKSSAPNEVSITDDILQNFDPVSSFEKEIHSTKKNKKKISCEVIHVESSSSSKEKNEDLVMIESLNEEENVESNHRMSQEMDTEVAAEFCPSLKNNCPKKKRKRHKKRKKPEETATAAVENSKFGSSFEALSNRIYKSNKDKFTPLTSATHLLVEPLCQENTEVTISEGDIEELQDVSADTYVVDELPKLDDHSKADYPKISTPAHSNGYSNPNWKVSFMQNGNSDFTNHRSSSPKNKVIKSKLQDEDVGRPIKSFEGDESFHTNKYENFPALKLLPEIGTHIAYKILELNETYNPVVSAFREGIVKDVNPLTGEMEVEFLKHEIKPGRKGKFENLVEDEVPPPQIKKSDTVIWSNLLEPKLLSL